MKFLNCLRLGLAIFALAIAPRAFAQTETPATSNDDKAEQIIQRALQVVGGHRYVQVKTVIGRGLFTDYHDGVSGIPMKFIDYIAYSDKERTEFSGGGAENIYNNFP